MRKPLFGAVAAATLMAASPAMAAVLYEVTNLGTLGGEL